MRRTRHALGTILAALLISILIAVPAWAETEPVASNEMRQGTVSDSAHGYSSTPAQHDQSIDGTTVNNDPSLEPVNENNLRVGFDALYGTSARFTKYTGEIPFATENASLEDGRKAAASDIAGYSRTWSADPESVTGDNWKEDSVSDLHANNLTREIGMADPIFRELDTMAANGVYALSQLSLSLLSLEISLATLDLGSVLDGTVFKDMADAVTLLLVGKEGSISPVIVIAVILYISSLVAAVFQYAVKGKGTARQLITELAMLLLAVTVSVSAMSGGLTSLRQSLFDLSGDAITEVAGTMGQETSSLYRWSTGDASDATRTLVSQTKQPFIEAVIRSQFGYPVEELEINEENFGLPQSRLDEIVDNLSGSHGSDLFSVSTGCGPNNYYEGGINNLGYYWYATLADVNAHDALKLENDEISARPSTGPDQYLFVVDFLSSVANDPDVPQDAALKCRQMVDQLFLCDSPASDALMLSIVYLAMALALGMAALFSVFGNVVFCAGVLFVPIFPVLLLIPKLRHLTVDLLRTWLTGLVRYIVGVGYVAVTLQLSAALCSRGFGGMALALIFLVILYLSGIRLFTAINNRLGRYEVPKVRAITKKYNDLCETVGMRRNPLRNAADAYRIRNKIEKKLEQRQSSHIEPLEPRDELEVVQGYSNIGTARY